MEISMEKYGRSIYLRETETVPSVCEMRNRCMSYCRVTLIFCHAWTVRPVSSLGTQLGVMFF